MTDKKKISELYDKHYGKKKSATKKEVSTHLKEGSKVSYAKQCFELAKAGAPVEVQNSKDEKITRAELMRRAKERGIKYFRILSREELLFIDSNTLTPDELQQIIDRAKNKWRAGWGKNGKRAQQQEVVNG